MTRSLDEAEARLWAIVTATVRPLPRRTPGAPPPPRPEAAADRGETSPERRPASPPPPPVSRPPPRPAARSAPKLQPIEPGRRRRIERGRSAPAGVLDLHGLNQDEARAALTRFLLSAHADNGRQVLVITGKGALGDGVLRRRLPDWLAEPPLRSVVAGLSEAHRRHGGGGAFYVALKRAVPDRGR